MKVHWLFLSAALLACTAQADDSLPLIDRLKGHGSGCPPGTFSGELTEDLNYEVTFTAFEAVSERAGLDARASCGLELGIVLPPGRKLQINEMIVQGFGQGAEGATRQVSADYQIRGFPRESFVWNLEPSPTLTDFSVSGSPSGSEWSRCGQRVVLTGSVTARARSAGGIAEIYLTNQIGRNEPAKMLWDWELTDCNPLEGVWRSSYTTASGGTVQSRLEFDGDGGRYTLGDREGGELFDVENDGNTVSGRWRVGGQDGWFVFEVDPNAAKFTGRWGYGDFGSPARGRWWGNAER